MQRHKSAGSWRIAPRARLSKCAPRARLSKCAPWARLLKCAPPARLLKLASCAGLAVATLHVTSASARDITFAVIGPNEYNLPTDGFKPFNVFVQYAEYNGTSTYFDDAGHSVKGPDETLVEGLSKYVHFWTFDGLPNVGFAYEFILPEVHLTGTDLEANGIGDPLTGPAVWFKPSPVTTLGFQTFLSVPIGNNEVSNHYWANYSSFFFDWEGNRLAFTGDAGAIFRSNQNDGDMPVVEEGNSYHANGRFSLKTGTVFEPFFAVDWQTNNSDSVSGVTVPLSSGYDTALGGGVYVQLGKNYSLTLRYSHSVAGRNQPITNAGYFKFAATF